jgi:uncharacterized membrane-anchored protein YitT (DUF2179 family)
MDIAKILKKVTSKNRLPRLLFMIIGVFLLALNYNLFLVKNELVIGGLSGLAIVFNKLWGWNNQIFIYTGSFILLIISFCIFGFEKTKPAIVGSVLYPFMISFTSPLADLLAKYFVFEDFITTITFTSILYGFSSGLIYKMGYNTGGSDIIMKILNKYLHLPEGRASFTTNLFIILFGGIVLGVNKVIYAIIILYISSLIVDKILIGISRSKLFIIRTNEEEKVMDMIMNEMHLGLTILQAKGGYSNKKQDMLMCVVPTKDYYLFKEVILAIDKDAFFIINDCYETEGGTTNAKSYGLDSLF